MGKSPLILAALAADAVPRIGFNRVGQVRRTGNLFRMEILGNDGRDYEVLYPANPAGNAEMAGEVGVLTLIKGARFDFQVPEVMGQTMASGQIPVAVVSRVLGEVPQAHKLLAGAFTESTAAALAQLHSMPTSYFADAGVPDFDTASLLHSRVAELDRMASTGRVPAALLGRWEAAMEDVTLFRFNPTVVHGSISDAALRLSGSRDGNRLLGVTDWSGLRIADPAEDFWWLVGGTLPETHQDLVANYRSRRAGADENILRRAALYSELQQGRWLLYCLELGQEDEIARAEEGLSELRDDLEAGNLIDLTGDNRPRVSAASERAVSATWLSDSNAGSPAPSFLAEAATEVLAHYESAPVDPSSSAERAARRTSTSEQAVKKSARKQKVSESYLDIEELF